MVSYDDIYRDTVEIAKQVLSAKAAQNETIDSALIRRVILTTYEALTKASGIDDIPV